MDRKQLSMFKEWFADAFPDCKDYLELTYFDAEQNTFLSKCSYNPDSGNAAKVLRTVLGSWQHQQAKMEELQVQLKGAQERAQLVLQYKDRYRLERDDLQKRVQFLEQELGAWKGKSIAAMINGMCKQCGKEPWQAIVSDKDGYALLHCFGCGANKYELVGEQALNGEGQ
ncbi:hypothetical protein PS357_08220 [Acinetobacter nosocomialis]|uniref:hypothetical protein n=1 Tax=Acinetobacter nosocomialis TaxID=106654 RepID=UPI002360C0F2|nr:hypothetical protein [Acinetobacter nosocomialis]MDC9815731.1 hypothetical protein [Acinetobacter nosocomialis]MDE9404953.1 hypothetical protein [Acinetobacter nosocomialis]